MSKFFIAATPEGITTVECRNGQSPYEVARIRQVLAGPYFGKPPGPEQMAIACRHEREWVPAVEQSND